MFRYLVSILTVGLISINSFAVLPKDKITYSFDENNYQPWNISCPKDKDKISSRCPASNFKVDPVCGYHEWSLSLINLTLMQPEEYLYIMEVNKSACVGNKQKYNPTIASNFSRPDLDRECEKYVKPILDTKNEIKVDDVDKEDESTKYFLKAFKDLDSTCFVPTKVIKIVDAPQPCSVQKVACSKFFKTSGGNIGELHRSLIDLLFSTNDKNKIKECVIFLAVNSKNEAFAYVDAELSWHIVGQESSTKTYNISQAYPSELKESLIAERFTRLPAGTTDVETAIGKANLRKSCSEEQKPVLVRNHFANARDLAAIEKEDRDNYTSGLLLTGAQVNNEIIEAEKNKEIENKNKGEDDGSKTSKNGDAGGAGSGNEEEQTATVTSCTEPDADTFTATDGNTTITLKGRCDSLCEEQTPAMDENQKKICKKRCLRERKGYTYYDSNNAGHKIPFQDEGIVFSSFKDVKGISYEQALTDYDACLVAIGKKMSKEQKWATGMQAGGMTANLLMGLFGMYQTTSANEDAFAMQMEMLKASDKCYSLKPDKEILKQDKRSFFGWIFSGFKSTNKSSYVTSENYTEEQKANNEKLKKPYNVRNPLTGLQQDMTPYEICVINLALAAMNQFSQNQMLCNQLYGSGLMSQTEYKYCLQGKTPAYARMGGNFAPVPQKSTPKDPEKQEDKKAEEPKKAPDGGGNPSAGAAAPSGSSGNDNNRTTPEYLRNSPYYRYNPSKQSNLDYQSRGYGYENTANQQGSVDVGTAGGNKSIGVAPQGSYLELTLPSVHNTTRENVGK